MLRVIAGAPTDRATSLLTRVGPIASVRVADALAVRAGWLTLTHMQLSPGGDLEALGQALTAGVVYGATPELQLYADLETGGLVGFDGDGSKLLLRGAVGLRWVLGGEAWTTF